ncbi:MAG: cupin domain-containing protein [Thermomicrobiales bacterium]
MPEFISFEQLLRGEARSFKFQGDEHGGLGFSFFIINYLQPGTGPVLHRHPYPEVFVTLEGEALYTVGEESFSVKAGQIVIAPANVPHKFVSVGNMPLKQVDIHGNGTIIQEDLEPPH